MPRRTAALLAALVLALALAGCGDDGPSGDVVVMGDSVTEQSADEIRDALGDETAVHAIAGIRTDELLPVAEDVLVEADEPPRIAVVMAGYNDLWQGREEQATVDELVAAMAGIDCAIWVLVPTVGPWERDRARAFDARVRAAAEAAGVAVETAWRDAVDEGDAAEPLVVPDEVHPSDAGRRRLADVMAAAVDRECG